MKISGEKWQAVCQTSKVSDTFGDKVEEMILLELCDPTGPDFVGLSNTWKCKVL